MPDDLELPGDLAIDTETMGLKPYRDRLCVVQISNGDGDAHLVHFSKDSTYQAPNLKKLLSNPESKKIFHYARFDIAIIKYYLGLDLENIYCTKIASKLCRTYTEFHGLKELCNELLGVSLSKAQQSSNWGAKQLSNAQIKYAAQDVLYLHQLKDILSEMLDSAGRTHLAESCFAFLNTRVELDLAGWASLDIFKH